MTSETKLAMLRDSRMLWAVLVVIVLLMPNSRARVIRRATTRQGRGKRQSPS